jgi:hypothetical protein
MRMKSTTGWFAAGREVAEAMGLLADTAFKLFMWLCLHADRSRGTIAAVPKVIAGALGKTEAEITKNLDDLFQREIGSSAILMHPAKNKLYKKCFKLRERWHLSPAIRNLFCRIPAF